MSVPFGSIGASNGFDRPFQGSGKSTTRCDCPPVLEDCSKFNTTRALPVGELKSQPYKQPFSAWNGMLGVLDVSRGGSSQQVYQPVLSSANTEAPNSTSGSYYDHAEFLDQFASANSNQAVRMSYLNQRYRTVTPQDPSFDRLAAPTQAITWSLDAILYQI